MEEMKEDKTQNVVEEEKENSLSFEFKLSNRDNNEEVVSLEFDDDHCHNTMPNE